MPERLECEVLQKARYINTLTFTFTFAFSVPNVMAVFPLTRASNAGGIGRNRDSEPIYGSTACCERQVQYTQPR